MKFAVCNETFQDWPLERACGFAAECGYTGLEIAPFTLHADARQITAAARRDVRQVAAAAGLEVIGLHWLLAKTEGFHLTSPDGDTRRRTADYLAELARLASDCGGALLVLGSPQQRNVLPGVSMDEALRYAADVLTTLLPTLEATGVVVAVEPLGPAEGNFLNTAAQAVRLIEMIGSPQVRLHLDCKAMSSEGQSIPDLLHAHRQLLVHFHANDPNRQGPGFGELDFVPILQALGQIDYRGWVSVEVFDYAPGPETLARQSIDYLRDCLQAIAAQ